MPVNGMRELIIDHDSQGALAVLSLGGFLAQLEVYKLKNVIDALLKSGKYLVILDLCRLQFIDSAGIGTLIQLRGECLKAHGQLMVVEAQAAQVHDALHTAAIDKMIEFYPTLDAARSAMRQRHGLQDSGNNVPLEARVEQLEAQLRSHIDLVRQLEARQGRIEELLLGLNQKIA